MNKLLKKENRYILSLLGIGGTGLTITAIRLGCNTIYCDQFVNNVYQRYRYGFPFPLNKRLQSLADDVLKDFKLDDKSNKFGFFSCVGGERFNVGCYSLRKVYIGLPFYFDYRKEKHVNRDELTFFGDQAPNWNSEDGKTFLKNLVLSDEAKKYAIAESVFIGKSKEDLFRYLSPFVASVFGALSYFKINYLLRDIRKLSRNSVASLSLIGSLLFSAIYYLFLRRLCEEYSRLVIDDFIRGIKDQRYIDGGFEYYYKKQKRNIAIRKFMGEDGHLDFKPNGDRNFWFSRRYSISEMIEKISEKDEFSKANN